jgi:dual specificity MAP kinase phosphatase
LETFEEWGVTAIVNMRTHSIHKDFKTVPLKILHLPTPDYYAPTQKQLEKGVKFIQNEVDEGGKVYIHCRQGEGRGPTMAIAYLISTGLTLEHAIQLVKKVRTFIHPTKDQLKALRNFEKIFDYEAAQTT